MSPNPPAPARARPGRQPFRSKFGGLVLLLVAALLGGGAVYWVVDAFAVESIGRFDIVIVGLLVLAALYCAGVGRQMLAPSAEAVLARDTRHPVVYLRPFVEDSRRIYTDPVGRRVGGRQSRGHPRRHRRSSVSPPRSNMSARSSPSARLGIPWRRWAPRASIWPTKRGSKGSRRWCAARRRSCCCPKPPTARAGK
ncbi:MAG: hypothetical protein EXQ89_02550 [Rhodospirillaceae bacterium]|nr:hypothetical protein [Rhodospirillaceae bacterium]